MTNTDDDRDFKIKDTVNERVNDYVFLCQKLGVDNQTAEKKRLVLDGQRSKNLGWFSKVTSTTGEKGKCPTSHQ